MKTSNFLKAASLGVLALSLTVLPVSAQNTPTDNVPDTTNSVPDTTTTIRTENGTDWGWLGLLGLFGLLGLNKRRYDEPSRYQDPDPINRTTTR